MPSLLDSDAPATAVSDTAVEAATDGGKNVAASSVSTDDSAGVDELTQAVTKLSVQPTEEKDTGSAAAAATEEEKDATKDDDEECWTDAPPSLRALASWIRDGTCQQILVLSGAGVSVAAGIPDFRTPGTGLYSNLQKYNLPFPEAVFDLDFYQHNPQPFVSLAREIWPGFTHKPTLTHSFVTLLEKKGKLLRNYSQNIDGLEFLAGLNADRLVECHGHFRSASCIRCQTTADIDTVRDNMVQHGKVTTCLKCGRYVKPDIVFFGEGLPGRFHRLLTQDKDQADLVLVLGTSLQVAPVSHIPQMVGRTCKRALVNREKVGVFEYTCRDEDDPEEDCVGDRDVFLAGDCDDSILQLARLLGWKDELEALHQQAAIAMKEKNKPKKKGK